MTARQPPLPVGQTDPIKNTETLAAFCDDMANERFLTVDTEFIRETTYWPRLCLIQVSGEKRAVTIDPLAKNIDLTPFFDLMADERVLKVFHAARQDLEIIWHLGRLIPAPVFDTQVAAMVCGYGDSIAYDQLVQRVCGARIDKSSRFTDWARRPLKEKQISYALSDVTYLRSVYISIKASLEEQGRSDWVDEEMAILTSQSTYDIRPEDAWQRLKMRVKRPRDLAVLKSVAEWREREAQARDTPRNRVLKDDGIYELAAQHPTTSDELAEMRAVPRGFERSRFAGGLIESVRAGLAIKDSKLPKIQRPPPLPEGVGATVDLLKVLLKAVSDQEGVAARVIATVDDLTQIAADDDAKVAALAGWRKEIFGKKALELKRGAVGLKVEKGQVRIVSI